MSSNNPDASEISNEGTMEICKDCTFNGQGFSACEYCEGENYERREN